MSVFFHIRLKSFVPWPKQITVQTNSPFVIPRATLWSFGDYAGEAMPS